MRRREGRGALKNGSRKAPREDRIDVGGGERVGRGTKSQRADVRTSGLTESMWKKFGKGSSEIETVQYVRFPAGPPREYWTRPWLLSFGDRTGSGVSNQV